VAIVIGAGNLWRGKVGLELVMDRATARLYGLLATVMNGPWREWMPRAQGVMTRVQSAIEMRFGSPSPTSAGAPSATGKGRVVIFGGGTGHP